MRFEHASIAILSPEPISIFLVRPDHNVEQLAPNSTLTPDDSHNVTGYYGRYNFRQPFWVVKGSRLYPPVPHIGLNISQDLGHDLRRCFSEAPQHHQLPDLVRQPIAPTAERVLTALNWYNRANSMMEDDNGAILDLAVAFESLLALPRDSKKDRFIDAVWLLLGRIPRLDIWADQFYKARSDITHEGRARQTRFVPPGAKNIGDRPLYRSLIADGRRIFQLCVGTLMFGANLAKSSDLQEKLETNEERFQFICRTLHDQSMAMAERFERVAEAVATIEDYRFVPETELLVKTMVGAVKGAAKCLISSGDPFDPVLKQCLENLVNVPHDIDWYEALGAIRAFSEMNIPALENSRSPLGLTHRLAKVVWHYTFMHYFWIERQRRKGTKAQGS